MLRSVRAAPAAGGGAARPARPSRGGARGRWRVAPRSAATALALYLSVTAAFFAAIRRHDVTLSFDQRLDLGRRLQPFGGKTVYVVDPARGERVLSRLAHDDWAKISEKIDYVAYVYDGVYIGDAFAALADALESVQPHGYGVALFECGCLVHNVLLQHVAVRFDGMECVLLPGFVLEDRAVRWVDAHLPADACRSRDRLLATKWYDLHSWKLQTAREEFARIRTHLSAEQHPDRPPLPPELPSVKVRV